MKISHSLLLIGIGLAGLPLHQPILGIFFAIGIVVLLELLS